MCFTVVAGLVDFTIAQGGIYDFALAGSREGRTKGGSEEVQISPKTTVTYFTVKRLDSLNSLIIKNNSIVEQVGKNNLVHMTLSGNSWSKWFFSAALN